MADVEAQEVFGLGGIELLIVLLVVGVPLFGAVDAALKPDAAFRAAGQRKLLWILLQVVGILVFGLGLLASGIYFLVVRPKVMAAGAT